LCTMEPAHDVATMTTPAIPSVASIHRWTR
jgi:hypothetical protein